MKSEPEEEIAKRADAEIREAKARVDAAERQLARAHEQLAHREQRIEELRQETALVIQWLDHVARSVGAILGSKRWRLGSFLIGTVARLLGRPYTPPDIGYMQETLSAFDQWKATREKHALETFLPPESAAGGTGLRIACRGHELCVQRPRVGGGHDNTAGRVRSRQWEATRA